ncbi:MAG: Sir2 family NAD-dependent protein deacetylase [Planctomycetes bacterium]|nr:Sir2 family NAD-dependent protein deacetylase [Planctomycetota bacterium]
MDANDAGQAARELARVIEAVERIVVFTGAGISTESGIPDFRSPGGVWSRYRPVLYPEFLASAEARRRYWQYKKEAYRDFDGAVPNGGHLAIAEMERHSKLQVLITQNIDGLHEMAGNSPDRILELHGTERWVNCLQCGDRTPRSEVQARLEAGEDVPPCRKCGGFLKPATISFGQALPEDLLQKAFEESQSCPAFLVIGSSLQVQPAASLPALAKRHGAWLGILNREETPLDPMADWLCRAPAGEVLGQTVKLWTRTRESGV